MGLIALIGTMPLTASFAVAGYASLLLVLIWPRARHTCRRLLALPTPSNQAHLAPLDVLRGLAALWVATFHFWQWSRPFMDAANVAAPLVSMGEKAVPVFVMLSGFLIYRAAQPIATTAEFRRYLRSRFLRIYPLYFVAITVALLAGQYRGDAPTAQAFLADAFMLRAIAYPGFVLPPIWSLYVEVLFYLLLPAFVVVAGSRPITGAVVALLVFTLGHPLGPRELGLWQYFCVGVIASELQQRYQSRVAAPWPCVIFAAGIILLLIDLNQAAAGDFDWIANVVNWLAPSLRLIGSYPKYTLDLGLAIGLIILGSSWSQTISRWCGWYPWRFLAAISYSVFIWHGLLILADFPLQFNESGRIIKLGAMPHGAPAWAMPAIVVPALMMAGALSFVVIERPFMLLRRPGLRRRCEALADSLGYDHFRSDGSGVTGAR